MKEFRYNDCKKGDLILMTTLNGADDMFCKFNEGSKLYARIDSLTKYMMTIIDDQSNRHTFLGEWFKETGDEFHGKPSIFNPSGIKVKFNRIEHNELPFRLKVKSFFKKF